MENLLTARGRIEPPLSGRATTLSGILLDRKTVIFLAIFVAVFVMVFSGFFLTDRLFYARDMAGLEIPMRRHIVGLMKEGHLPFWTEAYGNGQPVLANPKWAIFYPSTWLYLILPFAAAFKLHFLLHAVMAWIGLYVLGRSFGLSAEGSFLGAVSFLLGGFYLSSVEFYNHVAAFCWLPWLLVAVRGQTPRTLRTLVAQAGLWCLLILAGAPHFVPMAALFIALAIFLDGDRRPERLVIAFLAFVLALAIAAVQLVPTAELLKGKDRDPAENLKWSLEPVQLVDLAVPGFLGADRGSEDPAYWGHHLFDKSYPLYYSLYASPGLLLLALLGAIGRWDRNKVLLLTAAGAFLLLSMIHLFPFFSLLSKVPGVGLIRYPVNYFGGSLLSLSLLGAVGYEAARTRPRAAITLLSWVFPLSLAAAVALFLWPTQLLSPFVRLFVIDDPGQVSALESSFKHCAIATAAFSGLLLTTLRVKRGARGLLGLFIALLVLDLAVTNKGINPTAAPRFFDLPAIVSAEGRPVRVFREPSLPGDLGERLGFGLRYQRYLRSSLYPYTSVGHVHYVYDRDFFGLYSDDLRSVLEGLKKAGRETRRRILADAQCEYAISHISLLASGSSPILVEGRSVYFEAVGGGEGGPYLAEAIVRVGSVDEALDLFGREGFDPRKRIIVYDDIGYVSRQAASEAWITGREARAGQMTFSVKTPTPALAILPLRFDPGWVARLNGRKLRMFRANLISAAVPVPAGSYELTVRYAPPGLLWGSALSLAAVLGLAIVGVSSRRKRRQRI